MKHLLLIVYGLLTTAGYSQEYNLSDFQEVHIVIADTSSNYYQLHDKMTCISEKLLIEIDSMGREYDAENKLIRLPKNHEDEIYAGDYFPRRYPSKTLSIEHFEYYNIESSHLKCIVAGIYETKKEAVKRMKLIKPYSSNTFILSTKLYMGCMH